ncbi:hypothetical protein ES703_24539 [subsurface metagenome]
MFPVLTGYLCGTQGAGKDRDFHLDFDVPPVLGLSIYHREGSGIGITNNTSRQSFSTKGISLDIKMRVIDRIVLVTPGSDFTVGLGID